jgi:hypothetical protein
MSFKSKEIDERQFRGAICCAEIGHTALMEIATGLGFYLQHLQVGGKNDDVQSATYGLTAQR